jgi:TRAP-type C4-dicarboxylate transport system substrate-binding protein
LSELGVRPGECRNLHQLVSGEKPIKTPEDLRGFKIRVPNSPILISLFKSLQASPTSMNVNKVYAALQTRVVDGQENPLTVTATRNFNEVQKYCAVTNHSWDGFVQVANMAGWKKLPADIQEIITRNFDAAAVAQRDDTKALNESTRQERVVNNAQKQTNIYRPNEDATYSLWLDSASFCRM